MYVPHTCKHVILHGMYTCMAATTCLRHWVAVPEVVLFACVVACLTRYTSFLGWVVWDKYCGLFRVVTKALGTTTMLGWLWALECGWGAVHMHHT